MSSVTYGVEGDEDVPTTVRRLVEEVDEPATGFFGPGSVSWKVNRENAVLLAGVSAALLQVAHPKVAAGVAEHSSFEDDAVGRFKRTFEIVDSISFGAVSDAVEAALEVREIHDDVQGELTEGLGGFEEGERYSASDPDLLLWVHATLVEQALQGYRTFVGELSRGQRERYYQESKRFAVLMGVPPERLPRDLEEFYGYYRTTISDEIKVGSQGEAIKEALLGQWRGLGAPMELLAGGVMPAEVRGEYGIPWGAGRRAAFERFAAVTRATVPRLPRRVRFDDVYLESLDRLGRKPEDVGHPFLRLPPSAAPW